MSSQLGSNVHANSACNMVVLKGSRADVFGCRFLPYVGMVTIIMNDYPMLKYGLIAVLAVLVITSKE